jgi:hypothetical protein
MKRTQHSCLLQGQCNFQQKHNLRLSRAVTNSAMINEIEDPNKPLLAKIAELEYENKQLKSKSAIDGRPL